MLDRHIKRRYSGFLSDNCQIVTGADHPALSASLERFFLSVQYEMRTELNEKNLEEYIHFYNFERPHDALGGYTPACAWLTGWKDRFETFVKNAQSQDKEELFAEVTRSVESNYIKR